MNDLFAGGGGGGGATLRLVDDAARGTVCAGLITVELAEPAEVGALLAAGEARSRIAGTSLNAASNRSHRIFTIAAAPTPAAAAAAGLLAGGAPAPPRALARADGTRAQAPSPALGTSHWSTSRARRASGAAARRVIRRRRRGRCDCLVGMYNRLLLFACLFVGSIALPREACVVLLHSLVTCSVSFGQNESC